MENLQWGTRVQGEAEKSCRNRVGKAYEKAKSTTERERERAFQKQRGKEFVKWKKWESWD